ncbi:hypothetical protein ACFYY8_38035 [Streptosporangium sp. NPDC001559]|uniref:hypothetical protein n=1 Tax=Streptosporangium sp. NPDC001559 TaxID=3366187 RepID=UPI0036E0EF76
MVPVPASPSEEEKLAARVCVGAREVGVDHVLAGQVGERHAGEDVIRIPTAPSGPPNLPPRDTNLLLALADLSGAVLVTQEGYALIAGDSRFVRACLDEGIDRARARFARYARRLKGSRPDLPAIAGEFPPHRVTQPVPDRMAPGSGVAEQLALMRSLARGEMSAAAFMPAWLAARRHALTEGEHVPDPVDRVLTDVFYDLEDYTADPDLREPGDMSDGELTSRVRAALDKLGAADEL